MKKLYTLAAALLVGLSGYAQGSVTFKVDMNNETVAPEGVHLAGSFGDSGYTEWSPSAIAMTDGDMDGIYEVTLDLVGSYYEFKFINGNDWPQEEDVPNACQVEVSGNSNRFLNVSGNADYEVCFASCAPCGDYTVRFRVDMSLEEAVNPLGVHVAGNFQGWNPGGTELSDGDGDLVYEAIVSFDPTVLDLDGGNLIFKYINGDDWIWPNENVSGDCSDGTGNRLFSVVDDNTVLDVTCFGFCGTCVAPTVVTFSVDMSNETVSPNGVHIAGAFQGWNAGADEMTDPDMDGIYSITFDLQPGTYEYKFINGNNWDGENNSNETVPAGCNSNGNREITVEGEEMTIQYCYSQCEEVCIPNPDPAEITFRVNMAETTVSGDGLWMIGNFTVPQWQGGATAMTDDDADNVYECTVLVSGQAEISYKFVNGLLSEPSNEENTGLDICGVPNGIGGFNRIHNRSGSPEVLDIVCFNSCADCGVSVNDFNVQSNLSIFPNPGNGVFNFSFEAENARFAELRLLNSLGQVVFIENLGQMSGSVTLTRDLSALGKGFYLLQLQTPEGVAVRRLVIE